MDRISFFDEETNEEVIFCVLSMVSYEEDNYILVVEEAEIDLEEANAYVMREIEVSGDDVTYEIVEDDVILDVVYPMLEENIEDEDL
ncbi:MAG: DUF1292 domain-containing protein [Vallitaleaceae bacterium]|nr:DUF1292 domain-containing protein [Vallitaleaceae bacterium]